MNNSVKPMNVAVYGIQRMAVRKAISWFQDFCKETINTHISKQKSRDLVADLVIRDPNPLTDFLLGSSMLRQIKLEGDGTKNNPYKAVWANDFYKNYILR